MKQTKIERMARLINNMANLGFSYDETMILRRCQMTLRRWAENECGNGNNWGSWSIERDEETGKPFMVHHHYRHGQGKDSVTKTAIPDREKGALRRVSEIVGRHSGMVFYHQTDPRGCALYVGHESALAGQPIDQFYNRLLAVCED